MSPSGMLCPHLPHQRQLWDKEASQACHDIQSKPFGSKFTQGFGNALDSDICYECIYAYEKYLGLDLLIKDLISNSTDFATKISDFTVTTIMSGQCRFHLNNVKKKLRFWLGGASQRGKSFWKGKDWPKHIRSNGNRCLEHFFASFSCLFLRPCLHITLIHWQK